MAKRALGVEIEKLFKTDMRIAIIVNSFPKVSESFIVNKVVGLRNQGVEVNVITHSSKSDMKAYSDRFEGQQPTFIRQSPYSGPLFRRLIRVALTALLSPRVSLRLLKRSKRLHFGLRRRLRAIGLAMPISQSNYDLIHFEMSGIAVSYLDALPLLRPAVLVCSCRGAAEQISPRVSEKRVGELKQVLSEMDGVHCVSEDMQKTVCEFGLSPQKVLINRPAIDITRFIKPNNRGSGGGEEIHIATIGRLHWKKGLEFAVLALSELKSAGEEFTYHIVGGGDQEEKLRYLVSVLGLESNVIFHGTQSSEKVFEILAGIDIFLLPSLSEGLSNATLEAMAMEIPVVATEVGGMAEAITDGASGYLVPAMESHAMAAKIKVLINDRDLRVRIGAEARERVETFFSIDKQVQVFEDWYGSLIGKARQQV